MQPENAEVYLPKALNKKPSAKPYVVPIIIGALLGCVAAYCCAWISAMQFENYSFVAGLSFQPHLVSEAERLRREAALLIGAQSLVDNGMDFAFRGAAFVFFFSFVWKQAEKKLQLANQDLVYFFLGSRPFSLAGFLSSSFLEICLLSVLGLFATGITCAIVSCLFHMMAGSL